MKFVVILVIVSLVALIEAYPRAAIIELEADITNPPTTVKPTTKTTAKPTTKTTVRTTIKTTAKPTIKTTAKPTTKTTPKPTTKTTAKLTTAKLTTKTTAKPQTTTKPAATTTKAAGTTTKAAATTTKGAVTTTKPAATTTKATISNSTTTQSSATTTASSATTVSPSGYSAYQTYLINKAKSLVTAGTCNSVSQTCSTNCSTSATSLYYEWTDSSYRYILVSGIPNHSFGSGAVNPNPNTACESISYFKLPLNPVKGTTSQSTPMGPVGAAVTGAYFYNTLSSPQGSLAVPNEGDTLDSCTGHSDTSCRYHYHSQMVCVSNYNGGCVLLGYWYDGFPVYSYCPSPSDSTRMMTSCYTQNSGTTGLTNTDFSYSKTSSCDLDENNGYTYSNGTYAYYLTSSYPWVPVGYSGTMAGTICGV